MGIAVLWDYPNIYEFVNWLLKYCICHLSNKELYLSLYKVVNTTHEYFY